ncbi:hypothetical protein QUF95_15430 [Paenibacillus silvae]|uniref:hypothetical protein n=1 Tax=Paenibacillus silvae TaxID=1325358 RepID=UPI00259FEF7A|nr:hypothetical protein [Paenibacillus silvae]MDM5278789.1 hypothetical protein [Paenibacillus silvae]
MPGIDNYSLDNYGLDGTAVDFNGLKVYNGGVIPNTVGTKMYNNLGFKPVFAILFSSFSSGSLSYNLNYVMARGGSTTPISNSAGSNSSGNYYVAGLDAVDAVFGDDSLSFTNKSSVYGSVSILIYGY